MTTPVSSTSVIHMADTAIITRPSESPPHGFSGIINSQRCNCLMPTRKGICFGFVSKAEAISFLNSKTSLVKHTIDINTPRDSANHLWIFKHFFSYSISLLFCYLFFDAFKYPPFTFCKYCKLLLDVDLQGIQRFHHKRQINFSFFTKNNEAILQSKLSDSILLNRFLLKV